jgi:6-phosphogluconolactonase
VNPDILTFPDAGAAAEACGDAILRSLESSIRARGVATLAVSGGSSPKMMFDSMAKSGFEHWSSVHLFWVDERSVPPDHEQSNFRMTREHLIEPAGIRNVHRIPAELPPDHAARSYAEDIRVHFGSEGVPVFDVVHLGIGPDAHTASLFPGEALIEDREGIAAAVYVEKIPQWRITLLPAAILAAREVFVLAAGADKKHALQQILHAPDAHVEYPGQIVRLRQKAPIFYLDNACYT